MKRLRYFLRIAAEGSLGKASHALGIAQPALGRQIQLLEADVGAPLFQRLPKGMRLTEEGEYLRNGIAYPLQQIDIVLDNVRSFSSRVDAICTLGLQSHVARALGPPLLSRLQEELPNLKLRIIEGHPAQLVPGLLNGTIDVAVLAGFVPDDRLYHAEMLREPLVLVGAPQSRLAGLDSVRFADLEDFPLILPAQPDPLPTLLEKLAARTEARFTVAHEIGSVDLTKELVKAGKGYAILPPLLFRDEAQAGELISAPIVDPALDQGVHYTVQSHWRIPRGAYGRFHTIFYNVWMALIDEGTWPATWQYDREAIFRFV